MNGIRETYKTNKKMIWILAGVSVLIFYFVFDPLQTWFMPQCVFHKLTGWNCPGCGSQRMLHALLHGDFAGAFRANMMLTLCLPALLFMLWVELQRKRYPSLYKRIHSKWTIIITATIIMIWLPLRNILGC